MRRNALAQVSARMDRARVVDASRLVDLLGFNTGSFYWNISFLSSRRGRPEREPRGSVRARVCFNPSPDAVPIAPSLVIWLIYSENG